VHEYISANAGPLDHLTLEFGNPCSQGMDLGLGDVVLLLLLVD
jgi:hypothetical protein